MIIYETVSHGILNTEETVKITESNLIFTNKVNSSTNDLKTTTQSTKTPQT